jgi:bifunctional DNA-binding transcriptional regulator/antitoxin component of YhaV-PrlF toxin-antitoxin module
LEFIQGHSHDIDHAGRLVIRKDIRRESGIKPGMPLEVRWEKGASPSISRRTAAGSAGGLPLSFIPLFRDSLNRSE